MSALSPSVGNGGWHYLIFEREGGTTHLYYDGAWVQDYNTTGIRGGASFSLDFGKVINVSWLNGLIDEVAIWNRVLTANEISHLYNRGSGRSLLP